MQVHPVAGSSQSRTTQADTYMVVNPDLMRSQEAVVMNKKNGFEKLKLVFFRPLLFQ